MSNDKKTDNMAIWDEVAITDPEYTKETNHYGFLMTTVDATYQKRRATKMWGPYGAGWGMRDLEWGTLDGLEGAVYRTLDATFWYIDARLIERPEFPIGGEWKWIYKTSQGLKEERDCRFKLQTHLVGKALTYLGFSADVYLQKYEGIDDERYSSQADLAETIADSYGECQDESQLHKMHQEARKRGLTDWYWSILSNAFDEQLQRIRKAAETEE